MKKPVKVVANFRNQQNSWLYLNFWKDTIEEYRKIEILVLQKYCSNNNLVLSWFFLEGLLALNTFCGIMFMFATRKATQKEEISGISDF